MNAQDLKNSILQLAMQGKLVPQNLNDESAESLLESLDNFNNKSIIYNENGSYFEKIGEKDLICIDDEIPFDIPDSWRFCRLDTISKLNGGFAFKSSEFKNSGVRVIRISDFDENGFKNDKIVYYDENDNLNKYLLEDNDILIAMTGGTVGKTYLVEGLNKKMYVNQRVADIKIINGISIKYIYYIIQSAYIKKIIHKNKNSTNDNISMKTIKSFIIPIPPINEQQHIVDKIEEFLPLIEEYDINKEQLDKINAELSAKLKSSILQEAVQGKLVPQYPTDEPASVLLENIKQEKEQLIKAKKIKKNNKESVIFKENGHYYEQVGKKEPVCIDDDLPFDIPDSWEWCKLENIIELISGRDLKKSQYNDSEVGMPYITGASNIVDEDLIINRWTDNPAVIAIKNDILLTCKGTVGKILILNENEVHIARQIMSIRVIDGNLIDRDYIVVFLKYYVNKLIIAAKSMIPGISREDVLKINIPLPPLNEQKCIVDKVEQLFENIDVLSDE